MAAGITERDKKLLYFLGLIVIASLFFIIGIRPLNRKIKSVEKNIDDAQIVHDTIKMKVFQLGTIQAFKENAETMQKDLSSRYFEPMVSAEVDKWITNKALGYGLKVNNLSIQTGDEPVVLLPYKNSEQWEEYQHQLELAALVSNTDSGTADSTEAANDSAGTVNQSAGTGLIDIEELGSINNELGMYRVEDTSPADVYAVSMVLDVLGEPENEQVLLDELIKNNAIRVTSYEWTDSTTLPYQYVDGQLVQVGSGNGKRLVIKFDMYMYDGTEFNALLEREG